MTTHIIPVDPFVIVVFGATGDLSYRKLMPALFLRSREGHIPESARIIGTARQELSTEAFREHVLKALKTYLPKETLSDTHLHSFLNRIDYCALDALSEKGWSTFATTLNAAPAEHIRVFYMATTPECFQPICERLQKHQLISPSSRLVVEKPLGTNLPSAQAVNDALGHAFPERSIYRIDHYLGKETVQNLMALRFANALFEPLWNGRYIDHVQITVAESIGIESRYEYFDRTGTMRDMVQNHLLQLLCLVAMEPPASLSADAIRDEKLKVLKALDPINAANVSALTVRGQYQAGTVGGVSVRGYGEELGNPDSITETFVALKASIGTWRWGGVPFYLRTGKRLTKTISEIVVSFRPVPHSIFAPSAGPIEPNLLIIELQPNESINLQVMIKSPGPGGMRLKCVPLDMSFMESFGVHNPNAYERLILDVVRGHQTLFMRRDEVEAAWTWIDPIIEAWDATMLPIRYYGAGSWGPAAATSLIEQDKRHWHEQ